MFKIITYDKGCATHKPVISLKVLPKKPILPDWKQSYICSEGQPHSVSFMLVKHKSFTPKPRKRGPKVYLLMNKCKVGKWFKHKSTGEELYYGRQKEKLT
jgi:hypothetical protein